MGSSRTLIAFAYVAEQFSKTNDIAAGLIPLFAPLISSRAGKTFEPSQFAKDVKQAYDLTMHPYVAEELAPAMARHGYLIERRNGNVVHYINQKVELPEPPVSEEQLRSLVEEFERFAATSLTRANLPVDRNSFERELFDRLVRPDFMNLILRPDVESAGPRTILLPKARDAAEAATPAGDDEHYDYLVARFILHLHETNTSLFELLVAATSGALVAEVVLDLQHPPKPGESLAGVDLAIDSPLILDALGLGLDGSKEYASQLLTLARKAGANPIVFDGTIKEIERVIRSTLQAFERGQILYGPLGQKMRFNQAITAYARAVLQTLPEDIERLGVKQFAFSSFDRASRRAHFTEKLETELAANIGEYPTDQARLHDAEIVSDVLRIRGNNQAKGIRTSGIVFVTRNTRLARLVRRHLHEAALAARDYFPPCITDRYLAGILWITAGGGGETLSRLRLISNCSAAVVPRRDVVTRLHKFLEGLSPPLVERFEALMTNERAEHFLMDRTLADASLITQENYEEIYRDIEEVAAQRVTEKKDAEIAEIRVQHAQDSERRTNELQEAATRAMQLEDALNQKAKAAQQAQLDKQDAYDRLAASENQWASACLGAGNRAGFRSWLAVTGAVAVLAGAAAALAGDSLVARVVTFGLTFVAAFAASVIGSQYWPTNPLESWIRRRRQAAYDQFAIDNNVTAIVQKFEVDWGSKVIRVKVAVALPVASSAPQLPDSKR